MEEEGSYGIISYREIANLKKEIEDLKTKITVDSTKPLLDSMAKLSQDINGMSQLFKNAADELKLEEANQGQIVKESAHLSEKIEMISQQIKTIAEGMVSLAEIVRESKESKETAQAQPIPSMQQPPQPNYEQPIQPPQFSRMQPPTGIPQYQYRQPQMATPPSTIPEQQFQPFGMPQVDIGELPLEPFPPLPEKKRGILGRFRK